MESRQLENNSRGALIVLEGLDRCGKTSQCSRLLSTLESLGHSVESWRFPDRNTGVGKMISSYLNNQSQLDDRAIHLLFSANRWEKRFVFTWCSCLVIFSLVLNFCLTSALLASKLDFLVLVLFYLPVSEVH